MLLGHLPVDVEVLSGGVGPGKLEGMGLDGFGPLLFMAVIVVEALPELLLHEGTVEIGIEIVGLFASDFGQAGVSRQEYGFAIGHCFDDRQTEPFGYRGEDKGFAVLEIPVFHAFVDGTYDFDPLFDSISAGLVEYDIDIGRRVTGDNQLQIVALEQAGEYVEILFGQDGGYRKDEVAGGADFGRAYLAPVEVATVVYHVDSLVAYVGVGDEVVFGKLRDGYDSVGPVDQFLQFGHVFLLLAVALLVEKVQVVNGEEHFPVAGYVVGQLEGGVPQLAFGRAHDCDFVEQTFLLVIERFPPPAFVPAGHVEAQVELPMVFGDEGADKHVTEEEQPSIGIFHFFAIDDNHGRWY